ncbi:MAG: hypothetical protein U1E78_07185 [Gammaproteobacteria bacterium]
MDPNIENFCQSKNKLDISTDLENIKKMDVWDTISLTTFLASLRFAKTSLIAAPATILDLGCLYWS